MSNYPVPYDYQKPKKDFLASPTLPSTFQEGQKYADPVYGHSGVFTMEPNPHICGGGYSISHPELNQIYEPYGAPQADGTMSNYQPLNPPLTAAGPFPISNGLKPCPTYSYGKNWVKGSVEHYLYNRYKTTEKEQINLKEKYVTSGKVDVQNRTKKDYSGALHYLASGDPRYDEVREEFKSDLEYNLAMKKNEYYGREASFNYGSMIGHASPQLFTDNKARRKPKPSADRGHAEQMDNIDANIKRLEDELARLKTT